MVARRWPGCGQVAVPGDELSAFAVAADPFQLAALGPIGGHLRCRREFHGGVWDVRKQLLDRIEARFAESSDVVRRPAGRRSGSMCQAATPSRSKSSTRRSDFERRRHRVSKRLPAKWAATGSRSTPTTARCALRMRVRSPPMPQQRSAIAAVRPERGRPGSLSRRNRSALYAATHSSVACSRPMRVKNIRSAWVNFAVRAAAQLDLFEQQMRLRWPISCRGAGQSACAAASSLAANSARYARRFVARQPFVSASRYRRSSGRRCSTREANMTMAE